MTTHVHRRAAAGLVWLLLSCAHSLGGCTAAAPPGTTADPCAGKACGDTCSVPCPDGMLCAAVVSYCQADGACSNNTAPACSTHAAPPAASSEEDSCATGRRLLGLGQRLARSMSAGSVSGSSAGDSGSGSDSDNGGDSGAVLAFAVARVRQWMLAGECVGADDLPGFQQLLVNDLERSGDTYTATGVQQVGPPLLPRSERTRGGRCRTSEPCVRWRCRCRCRVWAARAQSGVASDPARRSRGAVGDSNAARAWRVGALATTGVWGSHTLARPDGLLARCLCAPRTPTHFGSTGSFQQVLW